MTSLSRRTLLGSALAGAGALAMPRAFAQSGKVRVGIIGPFSGPESIWGTQFRRGIELFVAENGTSVDGTEIEIVYRDEGGANPERARQMAQELIVREGVNVLGGLVFTPNAVAISPLITETKTPFFVFNAAASALTRQSPYLLRTSFSIWQVTQPLAEWAAEQGIKSAVIAVSDYSPGHESRDAFTAAFTEAGGTISEVVAMPLNTVDYSPFVQSILDRKPEAVFCFVPAGPNSIGFYKSFANLGGFKQGIKMLGTGNLDEADLPAIGDSALGVYTAFYYSWVLDNPTNKKFVTKFHEMFGADAIANPAAVSAHDSMHLIYETVRKLGGNVDGDAFMEAVKGMTIDSPRGALTIDPVERDVVQDIYIREIKKVDDQLVNVEFDKKPQVVDPWKVLNPA